jgi:hypothetical protein
VTDRAWQLAPGVAVRAVAGSPEAEALATIFSAFEVADEIVASRLSSSAVAGDELRVSLDGFELFTVPREALAPVLEGSLIGWVVRTRADVVPLHAAAIAWAGEAVLLLGDKGSGKSTLAAQLASQAGARLPYLGDEVAFVRIPDLALAPFPKAATIKAGAFAAMPVAPEWRDLVRGPVRYHTPAVTSRAPLPIGALVWPRWSASAGAPPPAELARLEPAEVAVRLLHQSFGGLERDPRTLDAIVALATRPAFELRHASAAAARAVLEEALGPP